MAKSQTPLKVFSTYYNVKTSTKINSGFVSVFYNPSQGSNSLQVGSIVDAITTLTQLQPSGTTWGFTCDSRINHFNAISF